MSSVSGGGEQVGGNEWADSACGQENWVLAAGLLRDDGNIDIGNDRWEGNWLTTALRAAISHVEAWPTPGIGESPLH
ncbi:hypothetical protein [Cryobacterium sp. M15]|jgi:hypothetical protein|uniref:hypothetical protein n=1 Tax=Cryobacterium sp. M15 TaxID=2048291 RepID=UPI000CE31C65|nr:hypothetical protein [Cryobacterium sp. M15]